MYVSDPNKDYEELAGMTDFGYHRRVWMIILTLVNLVNCSTNDFVFLENW